MNKEKLMTNFAKVGILIIAIAFTLSSPAIAWSKSTNVSVVDNYHSSKMGNIYTQDYPNQTFSTLAPSSLSASTLDNRDTLFLFATNPGLFNNTQKSLINSWIYNGGKLIIWDSRSHPEHRADGIIHGCPTHFQQVSPVQLETMARVSG